ncbi:phosphoenolpyruvate--protein phosphotransferase [Shewanella inventionis]|uniref:phosphoenolpyruvate--protein phosphotransferase n=1 Tax=Shewanella inventionis TaxID=1738770 RepID=A0ABQ1JRD6_9GAMM|nr:phosphoenolpyruvate--protein phosphotransferase [Shewanella inventionis]MCL1159844.1 phosphoenolpyruvate--protein phosphotransferase [Shewanella inventionis]UAL42741.1 phosphoenolpyruvate--protein phosphotransferase [Shewanella inventionis]GGB75652.1 phosphoenolpyruvate--protein phosphotransferase [Shewanella inventionis]
MLNMLRDITQAVARANSLESALNILVSQTRIAMATHCCSIYILEQHNLVLSATEGLEKSAVGRVSMPLTEGLVGLVAQREEAINLADARIHPRFKLFPEAVEEDYRAFLAVPIIFQKLVVGVIVVQQPEARQFSENEEAFLMTLAAQLAVVIKSLKHKATITNVQQQVVFNGVTASSGIAIAHGLVLGGTISLEQPELHCVDIDSELLRLKQAMQRCSDMLSAISQRFEREKSGDVASIFTAFQLLLDESSLGGEYAREVALGWQPESAVSRVSLRYIEQFLAMEDPYLKERASDIRELGQKVLRQLIEPGRLEVDPDKPVILVANEVDATLLAEFPRQKLAGIVTERGGVNAHAAILARALGVPAIVGTDDVLSTDIDKKLLVLNATRGQLLVSPSPAVVEEYQLLLDADVEKQKQFSAELSLPSVTTDGQRIQLYLNAGLLSGIASEIAEGADGIGLYRTEIPFMLHQRFPSESEQIDVYKRVLSAAGERPVVMRTLDVGGDKPLPYFPIKEDNPFLGWRGIRLSLDHPELFLVQLRAMLQAGGRGNQLQILLPMVSNLDEIDQTLAYLEQAFTELNQELNTILVRPKVGVMLEVPALLYQLQDVAKRVDFVSVGSNDLTQYLLAVDRNNPSVSSLFDSYHPGILRALQLAVDECHQYDLDVSVCGELAGEPYGALLLVAMGYRKLSMNQASLARINYIVRRVSQQDLSELLKIVLRQSNGQQVRTLLGQFMQTHDLADLINP